MSLNAMDQPGAVAMGGGQYPSIDYGSRGRVGILLPSGNVVAETDLRTVLPPALSLHTTRLRLTGSAPAELEAMTENVEEGASLIADAKPALIGFHCTAVSTLSDELEASLLTRIASSANQVAVVATSGAISAALSALQASKLVLVTPYVEHINETEIAFLKRRGFQVQYAAGLGIAQASEMARVEPDQWYEFVLGCSRPEADVYFISCTAVRSLEVVTALETRLGKPVITSNQAMAWHMMRTMAIDDQIPGFGRLLSHH